MNNTSNKTVIQNENSILGRSVVFNYLRGRVDPRAIKRLEDLGNLKTIMISTGIKPWTFLLLV
jgi:hypothetical protein